MGTCYGYLMRVPAAGTCLGYLPWVAAMGTCPRYLYEYLCGYLPWVPAAGTFHGYLQRVVYPTRSCISDNFEFILRGRALVLISSLSYTVMH